MNTTKYGHCDKCNTEGNFGSGERGKTLYAQDFDDKVYCDDCIPEENAWKLIEEEKQS